MKMMSKLLGHLGRVWNTAPKDFESLVLQQNNGAHSLITVETSQISFHSTPFRSSMTARQVLSLDAYSLSGLAEAINSLGYSAYITQKAVDSGYGSLKACTLMPIENVPILSATLSSFTSPLWQLLYPLSRLLEELDNDTEKAMAQVYTSSITGTWMDYWATFFKLKRLPEESDTHFQKRLFVALMNMKTNNVALQELLKYTTGGSAIVSDHAPAQFKVLIDPKYMSTVASVHQIITEAKGAGIDYFLNYLSVEEESYIAYFRDTNGVSFADSDAVRSLMNMTCSKHTYDYEQDRLKMFRVGFTKILTGGFKLLPKTTVSKSMRAVLAESSMSALGSYTEAFVAPLTSDSKSMQTTNSDVYLAPTEAEHREVHLSELTEAVVDIHTLEVLCTFLEEFETPLEEVASKIALVTCNNAYVPPSEVQSKSLVLTTEESYKDPTIKGTWGFTTNYSRTFSPTNALAKAKLSKRDIRMQETLSMLLTVDGVIIKAM